MTNHRISNRLISPLVIIRIGLGLVFLANALTAILEPNEFIELIESSWANSLLPVSTAALTKLIAVNDAIVAVLLLAGRGGRLLYLWAALWITGALAIIGRPLDMLEETGLLAMAAALIVAERK